MRIDVHTHFQCLDFVKHLQGRGTLPKSVLDGGTYIIQCAPGLNVPALPKIIDMEKKLRDMEDMKIDVAVLSHGIPFGPDVLSSQEADEWATRINDDLARIIAAYIQASSWGWAALVLAIASDRLLRWIAVSGNSVSEAFKSSRVSPISCSIPRNSFRFLDTSGCSGCRYIYIQPFLSTPSV